MLLGGDEIGRTQRGNNNGYCQDNETSWYDWEHVDKELLQFTQRLIRMRHQHPVFCRRRWFQGRPIHGTQVSDIGWFTPNGTEMSDEDWNAGFAKSLGVFLNGRAIPTPNERGERIYDESFYVMFNAGHEALEFNLPEEKWGIRWAMVLDTADDHDYLSEDDGGEEFGASDTVRVEAWSLVILRRTGWRPNPEAKKKAGK
jgi:glycogen operon protein